MTREIGWLRYFPSPSLVFGRSKKFFFLGSDEMLSRKLPKIHFSRSHQLLLRTDTDIVLAGLFDISLQISSTRGDFPRLFSQARGEEDI
jgi:hypothetical protein